MTIREKFIDELFRSGKFNLHSIAKALSISTRRKTKYGSAEELKAEVIIHLEGKVC